MNLHVKHSVKAHHVARYVLEITFATLVAMALIVAIPTNRSLAENDETGQLVTRQIRVVFPDGLPAKEDDNPSIYLRQGPSTSNTIYTFSPFGMPLYSPILTEGTEYTRSNPPLTTSDPNSLLYIDMGPYINLSGAEWGYCEYEYSDFGGDCEVTSFSPETLNLPRPYNSISYPTTVALGPFPMAADSVTKIEIRSRYNACTIIGTGGDCAGVSDNNGLGAILFTAQNLGDGANLPSLEAVDQNYTPAENPARGWESNIGSAVHGPNTSHLLNDVVPGSGYQVTFGSQSWAINGTFASTATWATCTFPRGGAICTPSAGSFSSFLPITATDIPGFNQSAEKFAGPFNVSADTVTRVVIKYGEAATNAQLTVVRVDETLSPTVSGTTAGVDSQSSATNPAVFSVASGQKTVTVTDLPDTRERFATCTHSLPSGSCALTATTSYAIADTCNGTTCSFSVNVPTNTGVRVAAAYQPLKFIINARTIVCDDESDLPNVQIRGDINHVWAQSPIVPSPGSIATFLSGVGNNCRVEDGWDFQWSFYNSSPVGPTHTGAAPVPANGVGRYFDFDTTSGESGSGSAAQAFIYDAASSTGWGTALNPNLPGSGMFWFKTNLKPGYLPFTTPPYQPDGGSPYSSELMCDVDRVNFDNWEWIRPRANVTTYWCYLLTAEAENVPDGSLYVHRVDDDGDELNNPSTEVSINPPSESDSHNPAEFEDFPTNISTTTVTFNDLDGFTEHVAICTNIVNNNSQQDCVPVADDYDFIPGEPYGTDPIMPDCDGDLCTFEVSVLPNIETHLYVKYEEESTRNAHILRVNDFLNLLAEDADGPKSYYDDGPGSIENPYEIENVTGGQHTFAVDEVLNYTVTYATCLYDTGDTPCYTYNATYLPTDCEDNKCSATGNMSTPSNQTRKIVFRYTPIEPTLECSVSRTSAPLGGTVTYTGVSNYNSSNTTPMKYAWSGSFGNPSSDISCAGQPSVQCQRITLRFNQPGTVTGVSVQGTVGVQTLNASCPAVNIIRSTIIEQ